MYLTTSAHAGTASPAGSYDPSSDISPQGVLTILAAAVLVGWLKYRKGKSTKEVPAKLPGPPPEGNPVHMQAMHGIPSDLAGSVVGGWEILSPGSGVTGLPLPPSPGECPPDPSLFPPSQPPFSSPEDIPGMPKRLGRSLSHPAWDAMCSARGLSGLERTGSLQESAFGVRVPVLFGGSLDAEKVRGKLTQVETGLDVKAGSIRLLPDAESAGRGILEIRLRDPLASGVTWPLPFGPVRLADPVFLGRTPEGRDVSFDVRQRTLVAGTSGSGKSCVQRILGAHVVASEDGLLELWDLKEGIEAQAYPDNVRKVTSAGEAAERIAWLRSEEIPRRAAKMRDRKVTSWKETPWDPALVIMVDEGNVIIRDLDGPVRTSLFTVVEQGRACGIYFVWATQYPKAANLPTELRSQFNARIVLRMMTADEAEKALSPEDIRSGWAPHCLSDHWFLLKDGTHTVPQEAKAAYLDADVFRDMSPGGGREGAGGRYTSPDGEGNGAEGREGREGHGPVVPRLGDMSPWPVVPGTEGRDTSPDGEGTEDMSVKDAVYLSLLLAEGPLSVREISRRTDRPYTSVNRVVRRLLEDGCICQEGGGFRLTDPE